MNKLIKASEVGAEIYQLLVESVEAEFGTESEEAIARILSVIVGVEQ